MLADIKDLIEELGWGTMGRVYVRKDTTFEINSNKIK